MAKPRSYKLLCPIARALDRIGDRWTLLILRDLHAGPARFTDLQSGLTGIAANLLTERLTKLSADGLIERVDAEHGLSLYQLTELGRQTRTILFDLALFGAQFPPSDKVVAPGNMRTVATTLGAAAERVDTTGMDFDAALVVDGEEIRLSVHDGAAVVQYGACERPDLILETSYEPLIAVSEGEIDLATFSADHARLQANSPGKGDQFLEFMAETLAVFNRAK